MPYVPFIYDAGGWQLPEDGGENAAQREVVVPVGVAEAKSVTVRKAGGGAFVASAGTTATQIEETLYTLAIDADDLDILGPLAFRLVGATDESYVIGLQVIESNPYRSFLREVVATHKAVAGSLAAVLNFLWRRNGQGFRREDITPQTIETYDGITDGDPLLITETIATYGGVTDITPS